MRDRDINITRIFPRTYFIFRVDAIENLQPRCREISRRVDSMVLTASKESEV